MKPQRSGDDRTRPAADVAGLLQLPPERELPGSRHRQLKEYLMQEITHEGAQNVTQAVTNEAPQEAPEAAALDVGAAARSRRPRRPRLGYIVAPLVAATAVAALIATGSNGAAPAGGGSAAGAETLKTLLDNVANVAASKSLPSVRDDQFVYVDSETAYVQYSVLIDPHGTSASPVVADSPVLAPLHQRQIWLSVNGSRAGQLRENGKTVTLTPNKTPYLNAPTYRYLETLPTDPSALLKKIYKDTNTTRPSEAFTTIGDLLEEQIAPPALTAALYRAAELIPGVRVINDVVDVTGHHEIAVALDDSAQTNEWLFNTSTLEFVGQQIVSRKADEFGPAGTVEGTQIMLQRAIVDDIGDTH